MKKISQTLILITSILLILTKIVVSIEPVNYKDLEADDQLKVLKYYADISSSRKSLGVRISNMEVYSLAESPSIMAQVETDGSHYSQQDKPEGMTEWNPDKIQDLLENAIWSSQLNPELDQSHQIAPRTYDAKYVLNVGMTPLKSQVNNEAIHKKKKKIGHNYQRNQEMINEISEAMRRYYFGDEGTYGPKGPLLKEMNRVIKNHLYEGNESLDSNDLQFVEKSIKWFKDLYKKNNNIEQETNSTSNKTLQNMKASLLK